ncbi:FAD-dependent monooxygenase OpS4 [Pseudocercospora fuligena]|uniref:FAD-dependent monooxygenase OpS4 n=1 Tax=Pseudocercospora fuligena TaxID=685502 RepID=A0A8H6RMF0_9PEZI|nr:FAD-dependent monooxygenase OpS4 [Pseudocercospora fuligena]
MKHSYQVEPATNGNGTNGTHPNDTGISNGGNTPRDSGLTVLIAGAGIGGLTAAIALRQQGHNVKILERSQFASELGAAIHLAPNSNGVLRRLGVMAEDFGSNLMCKLTETDHAGNVMKSIDLREPNKIWQHPWHLAHRIHLHEALKRAAIATTRKGKPCELFTASKVVAVDEIEGALTLDNGDIIRGDVIVGADGVHSVTRTRIAPDAKPFSCGKSAFRFLIPRDALKSDPATAHMVDDPGELKIWYAEDRRIVMYPTSNNTLLNYVAIHPESESNASSDWNNEASLEAMLKVFGKFEPSVLAMISKADPETLKAWTLLDMEEIPVWNKDRLALIGDAAHPFLPHQGQGAGAAIEDAAALATVLPLGTTAAEVAERLALYDQIRHERATKIQTFSRLIGSDNLQKNNLDMFQFTAYNFGHDEFDNSAQRFREYQWSKISNKYWRMPLAFGPMPGPRQNHYGHPRDGTQSTFTTASIRFKTSKTALQNLFPPGRSGYKFTTPGTIAYASFSQTTLNKMEWLGGSGYNHIGLYIHGVQYTKPDDGTTVSGTYMPILFESLTDPIVSGREELGMPKLYSAIDVHRRSSSYHIRTSWQGATWGSFHLSNLREVDPATSTGSISGEADDGIIVHRYIPATVKKNKGVAEADYACFDRFAEAEPKPKAERVWEAGDAKFEIDGLSWDELPTLHHVVSRLAELPVYEVMGAKVVEGRGVPDVSGCRPV